MLPLLRIFAWIACVIYSTIPAFWLLIHARTDYWRSRRTSPYKILLPVWIAMWFAVATITARWRGVTLYQNNWTWVPAALLFCAGLVLYRLSRAQFTLAQLGGLPELLPAHHQQRLETTGIRARVRHPVYLGHLCETLAWSLGTGLAMCWSLTAFAIITGSIMIKLEDQELEKRFGPTYLVYRNSVPALLPKFRRRLSV
jgi:protein-S-isoprenylcysteine O-methyltransferase Ste14